MLKKLFIFGCLFLFGTIHLYAQDELNPIKWSLSVEKLSKPLDKGENFNASLSAKIEKGWHLYALEKIEGGPIATRISLVDEQPFELGKIVPPKPIEIDDSAFGVTTKFYENSVKFILPIKVLEVFNSDFAKLQVKVRYQTCNDEVCLPPKTVTVESGFEKETEPK